MRRSLYVGVVAALAVAGLCVSAVGITALAQGGSPQQFAPDAQLEAAPADIAPADPSPSGLNGSRPASRASQNAIDEIVRLRDQIDSEPIEQNPLFAPFPAAGEASEPSDSSDDDGFAAALSELVKQIDPRIETDPLIPQPAVDPLFLPGISSITTPTDPFLLERQTSALGRASWMLEEAAQVLEDAQAYPQADSLRATADALRVEARRLREELQN